ncbi:probable serine/threonine-protein kinase DDB_G0282963 isoform X8 [Culex pipiens pallens]|uniref:probable serine/threonine-protein kinase DDB_G0282963 isoform X8 n=1 Tax=Culex pipiens pallens TaxID=42434 RepID=UPI0019545E2B|nr:probable serine/threonine-protein kinase DDB_G0282963 isoform X8 [Culex pipiens pallens]
MDIGMERHEGSATIGTLFQHIVNDMKNSSPLWDDFIAKATKLHACLRAAIQALAAYLEAFQKIADAATNSKGATKEIGTALTRVCLRHKAVETRMKTFTSAIMECLIVPLQEKLEDWKKQVAIIDKDHAKEYKRCRTELKKRSSDTLRLQKKAKKGGHHAGGGAGGQDSLHILVESSMQDVTLRRCELEEVERKSLRAIMVEERSRYCTFVNMLQPVVHDECEVMSELSHLQEAMQIIAVVTKDPAILPQASEELILESKTNMNLYPDSPGGSNSQGGCSNSLGSRKSSVCSISSINSSSSGSPGHQFQRSLSQYSPAIRLKPGESSDSGFCSSPALTSQASTLASQSHAVSTWPPHTQDGTATADRPHTISSAYEKGHQRPALTVYTFQNPEAISENNPKSPANISCRPPLPVRCSSLERPLSTASMKNANSNVPRQCPSPIPAHITKEHPQLQPTYVNMTELASMAASKITNNNTYNNNNATNQPQSGPSSTSSSSQQTSSSNSQAMQPLQMGYQQLQQQPNSPVLSSASSLISPDSSATNAISSPDVSACSTQTPQNTPQTGSPQTPIYSSSSSMVLVGTGPSDGVATGESNGGGGSTLAEGSAGIENKDILKCTGSVLEKTSMFEQQINNNQHTGAVLLNTPTRTENSGRKGEDIYKSTGLLSERDADRIDKETIEELNNLIGELDLFQKEHELRLEEHLQQPSHENGIQMASSNGNMSSNTSDSNGSDKVSISSSMNVEGLNLSLNSTSTNLAAFNYSDSQLQGCDGVDYPNTGFENPSFMHLNDSEIVVMRQNDFGKVDPENYYSQNMSEVVVLRCKDVTKSEQDGTLSGNGASNATDTNQQQRLSSFKLNSRSASPALSSFVVSRSPTPSLSIPPSNATTPTMPPSPQHSIAFPPSSNNNNFVISQNHHLHHQQQQQQQQQQHQQSHPKHFPNGATRVTRRSSINTVKPPPPVRRSSSVTPNPNLGTNNSPSLSQQSLVYTSSESLPPPPAYLLDSTAGSTPIPGNVAGTVKALNEIRHKPASPSVLRRAHQNLPTPQQLPTQQEQQQYATTNAYSGTLLHDPASSASSPYYTPQSQSPNAIYSSGESPNMSSNRTSKSPHHQGIYAQPKQLTSMSSFRTASPGPQKQNSGFLAQLNARIAPNKQPQQQSSPQHYQEQPAYTYTTAPSNEPMYHRGNVPDQRSSYNNSTSSNPHHQQQQMLLQQQQQQSTAASHGMYSSGPAQHHHQQQPNGQRDGKNQVYSSTHSQNQQQIQQQQQYYYQPQSNYATQNIYVSTNPFAAAAAATGSPVHSTYSPSSFGKMPRDGQTSSAAASSSGLPTPVVTSVSSIGHDQPGHGHHHHNRSNHQMRTGSNSAANSTANNVLAKTSVGFLENLNARLAEQRLSGKAFAVRSLINSKALPDPRICHESLMDQIKRGATLKRNRTINDRSAPKIH